MTQDQVNAMVDDKEMAAYLKLFGEVYRKRLHCQRIEPIRSAIEKSGVFKTNPFDRQTILESSLMEMREKLHSKYGCPGDDFIETCERMAVDAIMKEEMDSHTMSELRDQLRCYTCKHFDLQANEWCRKMAEAPPLFIGHCEQREKAPNTMKDFV